tara:strand:- start:42732 stop:42881 length:150 start_codon:yes stop_codon:yes gene_type:complete
LLALVHAASQHNSCVKEKVKKTFVVSKILRHDKGSQTRGFNCRVATQIQ